MVRRLLIAVLVLAAGSLLVLGHVRAQTVYTTDSLAAVILTPDDINAVLSASGVCGSVMDDAGVGATGGATINVRRVLKTDVGIIAVVLFSNADGSGPTTDQQNGVLTGQFLSDFANGVFSPVDGFTLGGSAGAGDADQVASFAGNIQGVALNVVGDSFIKGNVFGVVLYGTPGDNSGYITGLLAGAQVAKLG